MRMNTYEVCSVCITVQVICIVLITELRMYQQFTRHNRVVLKALSSERHRDVNTAAIQQI